MLPLIPILLYHAGDRPYAFLNLGVWGRAPVIIDILNTISCITH